MDFHQNQTASLILISTDQIFVIITSFPKLVNYFKVYSRGKEKDISELAKDKIKNKKNYLKHLSFSKPDDNQNNIEGGSDKTIQKKRNIFFVNEFDKTQKSKKNAKQIAGLYEHTATRMSLKSLPAPNSFPVLSSL